MHDHETSECWLIDLRAPDATPTLVAARETSVHYDVEHHPSFGGAPALIIRTNADGAEDFKIAGRRSRRPGRDHWRDLVPHRPGVYILSVAVFADWLIRLEREDGLPRIVVRHLASGDEHAIAFPEEAYSLGIDAGLRVRDRHSALHLFVDDDAVRGVGLRSCGSARACCASARKSRAATIRPTT